MWWRTHCDKTEPLSKRVPLRDRIVNGDFDFSSYYWQAQSAAIVGRNKLDLTKDEKEVFLTFKEINKLELVRQAAVRQEYLDQGQSINLAFNKLISFNSDFKVSIVE